MAEGQINNMFEKPGEACGVFGVYGPDLPVAEITLKGLHALQHRGQQSAGISVSDGEGIYVTSNPGRVAEVFPDNGIIDGLGQREERLLATGQTRYGTSNNGSSRYGPLQPMHFINGELEFTFSHNGHDEPLSLRSDISDSHAMMQDIGREYVDQGDFVGALKTALEPVQGAYSLVLSTPNELFAVRDPRGFRPLHLGRLGSQGWVVSSEISGLDVARAEPVREIKPGEILRINAADEEGLTSFNISDEETDPALCGFEFVYFSRPDNEMYGELVLDVRQRMGAMLAKRDRVNADMVIGVPESGMAGADGYSLEKGLIHEKALVRNNSIPRTFIAEGQDKRVEAVYNKLNPISRKIKGQSLVIVDDSIVRGTTTRALVEMLREAGATEVHLRITSPPYAWPCFFGMDTRNREDLIASKLSVDEIREHVGADSLDYLTNEEMQDAIGNAAGKICTACTTGVYPVELPVEIPESFLRAPSRKPSQSVKIL